MLLLINTRETKKIKQTGGQFKSKYNNLKPISQGLVKLDLITKDPICFKVYLVSIEDELIKFTNYNKFKQ